MLACIVGYGTAKIALPFTAAYGHMCIFLPTCTVELAKAAGCFEDHERFADQTNVVDSDDLDALDSEA